MKIRRLTELAATLVAPQLPHIPVAHLSEEIIECILLNVSHWELVSFEERKDKKGRTDLIWKQFCFKRFGSSDILHHLDQFRHCLVDEERERKGDEEAEENGKGEENFEKEKKMECENEWRSRFWELFLRELLQIPSFTLQNQVDLQETLTKCGKFISFARLQGRFSWAFPLLAEQLLHLKFIDFHNIANKNVKAVTHILQTRCSDLRSLSFYFLRVLPSDVISLFPDPKTWMNETEIQEEIPKKKRRTSFFTELVTFRCVSCPQISLQLHQRDETATPPQQAPSIRALGSFLGHCFSLRKIDLIDCDLGDCDLCSLYHIALRHLNLEFLSVQHNRISCSASHLALLLCGICTNLKDRTQDQQALPFPSQSLVELSGDDPRNFQRTDRERLNCCLKRTLLSEKRPDDLIEDSYPSQVSLTHLSLANNQIGEFECAFLAECLLSATCLTSLDISNNHIGDSGMQSLVLSLSKTSVMCLKACVCGFTSRTVELLCEILCNGGASCLQELYLDGNDMLESHQKGLWGQVLANGPPLKILSLNRTWLGTDANSSSLFARGLALNGGHLQKLCVAENRIGDSGAVAILGGATSLKSGLSCLNLSGNLLSKRFFEEAVGLFSFEQQHFLPVDRAKQRRTQKQEDENEKRCQLKVLDLTKNNLSSSECQKSLPFFQQYIQEILVDHGEYCGRLLCDGIQEV